MDLPSLQRRMQKGELSPGEFIQSIAYKVLFHFFFGVFSLSSSALFPCIVQGDQNEAPDAYFKDFPHFGPHHDCVRHILMNDGCLHVETDPHLLVQLTSNNGIALASVGVQLVLKYKCVPDVLRLACGD